MKTQKIGILTDSGTDVPVAFAQQHGIRVVPLSIRFSDATYEDGEFGYDELFARLESESPKTSLPSPKHILDVFSEFEKEGVTQILCITISSALSGTGGLISILKDEFPQLDCRVIDTRNIGIAAGLSVMTAAEMIEEGHDIDTIENHLLRHVPDTRVFFYIPTLEYLKRGGRIGRVAATLGIALGIRPIISCDENGVYHPVAKPRGQVKAIAAAIKLAEDFAKGHPCRVAVANANAKDIAQRILAELRLKITGAKCYLEGEVSAVLCAHTGPGLVGIAIQRLD